MPASCALRGEPVGDGRSSACGDLTELGGKDRSSSTNDTEYGYITPENLALFTDLYELKMMQAYHNQEHDPEATFDLFFRDLPPDRGYMIAAGLEQAIHYIETLSFTDRAIDYLSDEGFDEAFLSHLETLEFTGEVRVLPEGTAVFPNEPLLEVTAPILQGQLLETIVGIDRIRPSDSRETRIFL